MPEIKNVIPDEDELYAYYRECRPDPASRDFRGYDDVEEAAQRFGCREYLCKVDAIVWDGLKWMNNLDRNHSFWTGTNLRPTVFKLFDFVKMILDSEPDNLRAVWLRAVEDTFSGSNDFGEEWWIRLWQMGGLDVRWPIRAGLWNEMMLGFDHDGVGGCCGRWVRHPKDVSISPRSALQRTIGSASGRRNRLHPAISSVRR